MSIRCKAALTKGAGTFEIEEIDVSDPGPDEVLVRMRASGICHTDYDSLRWGNHMILGHEGAGVVEKIGSAVRDVRVGDHVILNWAIPCRECYQCLHGNEHLCERNSFVLAGNSGFSAGHAHPEGTTHGGQPLARSFNIGTLSEYTLVKHAAVVPVTHSVPFPSAAIVGCGVMTGYGSVVNAARIQKGDSVAVIGAGGVGLNVIQAARLSGASQIIVIDSNASRLQFAKSFGATHLIPGDPGDMEMKNAVAEVKGLTEGRGVDFAFECTAIPALGAAPLRLLRHGGKALQLSGIEQDIVVDMRLFEWDKTYINPLYGQCKPHIDFPDIIAKYLDGHLKLDELVSARYKIQDLGRAFEEMLAGKIAKGVIVFP